MTTPTIHERATRIQELTTPVARAVLLAGALVLCLKVAGLPDDWAYAALTFFATWIVYVFFLFVLRELLAPQDARFQLLHLGPTATVNVLILLRRLALYSACLVPPTWSLDILGYARQDVSILLSVCHVGGLATIALWTVYARGGPSDFLPPHDSQSLRLLRRVSGPVLWAVAAALFAIALIKALGYQNLAAYIVRVLWLNILLMFAAFIAHQIVTSRVPTGSRVARWFRAGPWIVVLVAQIRIWGLHYYHWVGLKDVLERPLFAVGDSQISSYAILRALLLVTAVYIIAHLLRTWLDRSDRIKRRYGAGVRYAIANLSFYTIVAAGVFWAMLVSGFPLNALTVFAGMAGIGVGFGLQDIIRNFVAGLILLIERPLSVGDFIDVGGVKGQVTRISLRSTIMRTADNVHILVPNSDLTSQQVTNLSHQDLKVRLRIPVGVSYDSNVDQVCEVLLQVARTHPNVLDEPEPKARLLSFGDSSLDFELHAWIPDPDQKLVTTTELNLAVWHAFQKANIQIPFPQRDLHIRSTSGAESSVELPQSPPDGGRATHQAVKSGPYCG